MDQILRCGQHATLTISLAACRWLWHGQRQGGERRARAGAWPWYAEQQALMRHDSFDV
jgi:hypothetical protein